MIGVQRGAWRSLGAVDQAAGSITIFGLGYGVELLSDIAWLQDRAIYYWGDIDTHGFAMLDRLRKSYPQTQAFLMDRSTLLAHRPLWGTEPSPYKGDLTRLRDEERALYDDLHSDRLGHGVRLEQERIRFGWLRRMLTEITPCSADQDGDQTVASLTVG